ncbi:MAG TPA: hypothetical protein VKU00_22610, partial [Chthonomonadaceae bacterium]|nr:hypothetical protein [Chthonomonadaceae bacterium]
EGGGYRLYAYISDGHGNAAVGNIPLRVNGPVPIPKSRVAKLPLTLYDEAGRADPPYLPTGWMGNIKALKLDAECTETPHSGKTCLRIDYQEKEGWGGIVWQSPPNDWGDKPGGWDLTGAKRLTFWARGGTGDEVLTCSFGLLGRDKKFFDTATGKLENVKLSKTWQQYSLDLAGKDLTRIKTGFACILASKGAPITLYLDDIRFE